MLLLAPVLLLAGLLFLRPGAGRGQPPLGGPTGTIVVAFTGNFLPNFRSISFNIASVRLNPSGDPNVSEFDPNWVTVPVAAGVGLNNGGTTNPFTSLGNLFNFNNNLSAFGLGNGAQAPASIGTGQSELQVDINQVQSLPEVFNSWTVPASTYFQIEVVLEGSNAGTVIPNCSINPLEGCIASQIALVNPSQFLRTTGTVTVANGGVTTLVININPINPANQTIPTPPPFSGGLYTFSPFISIAPTTPNPLGLITGAATGATKVLAELSGTDQIVETTTTGNATYTLALPATVSGTLYDLVASGPNSAYAIAHNVLVTRGLQKSVILNSTPDPGAFVSGKITDGCSGAPIQGATIEIVTPAPGTADDCANLPTPSNCVVLASANTDDTGTYPMPSSNFVVQPFRNIAGGAYTMVVSAAGYDTITSGLGVSGAGAGCSAGTAGSCNFALGHSLIQGLVAITPPIPAGAAALNVLVTAEDHDTHQIENVALAEMPPGSGLAPFSMNVPDEVASLDMYAVVSDTFNGLPERDSGHTIAVMSGIEGGFRCATNPANPILAMQCAGHASVTGLASTFDDGTSIVLSKEGVQLMTSNVGAAGSPVAGQFTFCAPADPGPYTLQRFEASPPGTTPAPAAKLVSVTLTPPTAIPPPCTSICATANGTCLVCLDKPGVTVK